MNKIDLQNRSAVITGGAQGIGLAIAERLLMSGASVSLWDLDETLVKKTANTLASKGNVEYVVMDVTNLDSVKKATNQTKDDYKKIFVPNSSLAYILIEGLCMAEWKPED